MSHPMKPLHKQSGPVNRIGSREMVRVPRSAEEDDDLRWWYGAANGAMTSYRHMAEELNRRYHKGKPVRKISAVCRRDGHINYGKSWGRHSNASGETRLPSAPYSP